MFTIILFCDLVLLYFCLSSAGSCAKYTDTGRCYKNLPNLLSMLGQEPLIVVSIQSLINLQNCVLHFLYIHIFLS